MRFLTDRVAGIEKGAIINALTVYDRIIAKAAIKLGVTERILGYRIRKYGITRKAREK